MSQLDPVVIGLVCSSGGGTVMAAADIYERVCPGRFVWRIVTDRDCGIERVCEQKGIISKRFEIKNRAAFSQAAADYFSGQGGVSCVLLFFLRLVSGALYDRFPTLNFHPSLLPAFSGFQAVERALQSRVKYLGVTLHMADSGTDGGQIVSQAIYPLKAGLSIEEAQRLSFAQKLLLCLGLMEMLDKGRVRFEKAGTEGFFCSYTEPLTKNCFSNPSLQAPELVAAYNEFLIGEGLREYLLKEAYV